MRAVPVLLLLAVLASGCLQLRAPGPGPEAGARVPPLLEPLPRDPSLTLVAGDGGADADGFHATLRTAGPLRQDWEGSYQATFTWLRPWDGPGPIDYVRYDAFGAWETDAQAWRFGWWVEERLCGDCAPRSVQLEGTATAEGDTMAWTIPYANASHAALPFKARFASHLMSEGGCDYDEWPWGDQERTQGCPSRRPAGVPLDAPVGDAWQTPGQVGPAAVRWAIDGDQAAVDLHFPGPAIDALRGHLLEARLVVPGPDGWTTHVQVADADGDFWPGDARIDASDPPPGGAGLWDRLDTRGSRIVGSAVHAQWVLAKPGPVPDPGQVRLSFALVDMDRLCTLRWAGDAADRWDLPGDCPPAP